MHTANLYMTHLRVVQCTPHTAVHEGLTMTQSVYWGYDIYTVAEFLSVVPL